MLLSVLLILLLVGMMVVMLMRMLLLNLLLTLLVLLKLLVLQLLLLLPIVALMLQRLFCVLVLLVVMALVCLLWHQRLLKLLVLVRRRSRRGRRSILLGNCLKPLSAICLLPVHKVIQPRSGSISRMPLPLTPRQLIEGVLVRLICHGATTATLGQLQHSRVYVDVGVINVEKRALGSG